MIITREDNGELVKVLSVPSDVTDYGLHSLFGFVSALESEKRSKSRKRRGYIDTKNNWNCRFEVSRKNKKTCIRALDNCKIVEDDGKWKLNSSFGTFILSDKILASNIGSGIISDHQEQEDIGKSYLISLIFLLFVFIGLYWSSQNIPKIVKVIKPITVRMVEIKHEILKIRGPKTQIKKKVLTKKQKANRAIKQNLGFLGLLGKKSLTKAVGGMPIKLKKVTAGAGKGGDAGSGGELLVGLGKAVKRATVGNTGTKGLGGIGTKGAGGGAGGYGTTSIASGEGAGISAVAISNDVTLEGGLSRGVIMATIQKYLAQIKSCYNQGLKTSPGLEGTVNMDFRILATGFLKYARVASSSLGSKVVESCMSNKMMSWQFPKPRGGVSQDVRFPFSLRPESI